MDDEKKKYPFPEYSCAREYSGSTFAAGVDDSPPIPLPHHLELRGLAVIEIGATPFLRTLDIGKSAFVPFFRLLRRFPLRTNGGNNELNQLQRPTLEPSWARPRRA